ncbi:MAG: hypothetical protein NC916_02005 [Candidatus Omnitrophica bacterium]|nr:hypothetical protein [Candidatus Omnitrophota bacterium]
MMQSKLEKIITFVYKKWKADQPKQTENHLDEETIACLLEGRLSETEFSVLKEHLIACESCLDKLTLNLELEPKVKQNIPHDLLNRVKKLLSGRDEVPLLEVILRLKDKFLEIVNTTGDILVGQELMPAPVLRSRQIKNFKDEVTILKDFQDIRVEIKIENKTGESFSVTILARQKETQEIVKDLRIALIREDTELESYVTDSGSVTFDNVAIGKYSIAISTIDTKLAFILLDIKI